MVVWSKIGRIDTGMSIVFASSGTRFHGTVRLKSWTKLHSPSSNEQFASCWTATTSKWRSFQYTASIRPTNFKTFLRIVGLITTYSLLIARSHDFLQIHVRIIQKCETKTVQKTEAAMFRKVKIWRKLIKAPEGADGHRRVTLTLTLDRIKVISACTIHIGLPAYPTTWL